MRCSKSTYCMVYCFGVHFTFGHVVTWVILSRGKNRTDRRDGCLERASSTWRGIERWHERLKKWERRGGDSERWLKTDRGICHQWRNETSRVRRTEGREIETDRVKERGEGPQREMERGSGGIIMTKRQEDDGSMGHVYPQEWESERDGIESGGRVATADWRVTLFTGKRRGWGILMWGGRTEMRRDSLGWKEPLAQKRERNDEVKNGQKCWEPAKGRIVTEGRDEGTKRRAVEEKTEIELLWVLKNAGDEESSLKQMDFFFFVQTRESTGLGREDWVSVAEKHNELSVRGTEKGEKKSSFKVRESCIQGLERKTCGIPNLSASERSPLSQLVMRIGSSKRTQCVRPSYNLGQPQ